MSVYSEAVDRGLARRHAASSGPCPGCLQCAESAGIAFCDDEGNDRPEADIRAEHDRMWRNGEDLGDEGSFSWRPCGICGTTLGGNRYVWHWISPGTNGSLLGTDGATIEHESDMCEDCVMYLANGDEPDRWRRSAADSHSE